MDGKLLEEQALFFKNKAISLILKTSLQSMYSLSDHLWGRNLEPYEKLNTEAENYVMGLQKIMLNTIWHDHKTAKCIWQPMKVRIF